MASFHGKIGWGWLRKRENKIIVPFSSWPRDQKKFHKNSKKIFKIPLWRHFRPKFVGKCREREQKKIIVPFRFYPTRNRKFHKISKKIQKIEKYHYGFIPSQNRLEKAEKERK